MAYAALLLLLLMKGASRHSGHREPRPRTTHRSNGGLRQAQSPVGTRGWTHLYSSNRFALHLSITKIPYLNITDWYRTQAHEVLNSGGMAEYRSRSFSSDTTSFLDKIAQSDDTLEPFLGLIKMD